MKRAVGLPGENFRIVNDTILINGVPQALPANAQFSYIVASSRILSDDDLLHELGIAADDVHLLDFSPDERGYLSAVLPGATTSPYIYMLPLTNEMIGQLTDRGYIDGLRKTNDIFPTTGEQAFLFPAALSAEWTLSNYGGEQGLLIPAKGTTVELTPYNWYIYERCIRNYEGHTDSWLADDGTVYIDGKPAAEYTFAMDYYFMMGDNRDLSQDSRFWGFVPEDHIVGSPMMVLISFDKDRSLFNGGIRWNRILRDANPDK